MDPGPVVVGVDFGVANPAYCTASWDAAASDFVVHSWAKCNLPADGDATQYTREQAAIELLLTDGNTGRATHFDLGTPRIIRSNALLTDPTELQVPIRRKPNGEAIIPRIDLHDANIRCYGLSRAVGAGIYAAHRTAPRQPTVLFSHPRYKFSTLGMACPPASYARKNLAVDLVDAYLRSRLASTSGEALRRWRHWSEVWESQRGRTKKLSKLDDLADAMLMAVARLVKLHCKGKSKRALALKRAMTDRFLVRTAPVVIDLDDSDDSSVPKRQRSDSNNDSDDILESE